MNHARRRQAKLFRHQTRERHLLKKSGNQRHQQEPPAHSQHAAIGEMNVDRLFQCKIPTVCATAGVVLAEAPSSVQQL